MRIRTMLFLVTRCAAAVFGAAYLVMEMVDLTFDRTNGLCFTAPHEPRLCIQKK